MRAGGRASGGADVVLELDGLPTTWRSAWRWIAGAVGRGRSAPWSGVGEVRPPSRWLRHAELRGTRAADAPVALVGMTAQQAVELGRRLVEAREHASHHGSTP